MGEDAAGGPVARQRFRLAAMATLLAGCVLGVGALRRRRRNADLATEARALEDDEADQAEMLATAGLMESLRPPD